MGSNGEHTTVVFLSILPPLPMDTGGFNTTPSQEKAGEGLQNRNAPIQIHVILVFSMVIVVVLTNLLFSWFCLFIAWKLFNLCHLLSRWADMFLVYERNTRQSLQGMPGFIRETEKGTRALRRGYGLMERRVESQVKLLRRVIQLLRWGQWLWQRRNKTSRPLTKGRHGL
ncbi:MAG: hypothetical protein VKL00_06675 [Synechococcales bacterium]|nr:hypothetical protein [Synechococcales bacterium]